MWGQKRTLAGVLTNCTPPEGSFERPRIIVRAAKVPFTKTLADLM
jgi:hypothetical protein